VLLGLPGLTQHPIEKSLRSNLRVPMRNRNSTRDPTSIVSKDPQLVTTAACKVEAVAPQHRSKLIQARRQPPSLVGELEAFEPAENRRVEERDVLLLTCQFYCQVRLLLLDVAQPLAGGCEYVAKRL
jgi:hypothetical protein